MVRLGSGLAFQIHTMEDRLMCECTLVIAFEYVILHVNDTIALTQVSPSYVEA